LLRLFLIWPALLGLYLLLSGDVGTSELIAGCAVATVGTAFVARLHAIAQRRFGLPPGWLGVIVKSLAGVVPDTARVGRVLVGTLRHRPLHAVGAVERITLPTTDPGRRAAETLGQSLSPNGYVLCVGDDGLRLHRLARSGE